MLINSARRSTRLLTLAIAVLALLAVSGIWHSASARADTNYPPQTSCAVSLSSTTVTPGESVTVTGSGFAANKPVTLTLHSSAEFALGSVTADGTGAFRTTVVVPQSAAGGSHTLTADSGGTSCPAVASVNTSGVEGLSVHRTTDPKPKATSGVAGLATTGVAVLTLGAIGVAVIAGGLLFLVIGRRRRA